MQFEDGLHMISNADYHASKGYSRSSLMPLLQSEQHFWYKVLAGKYQQKVTEDFKLGNLCHTLLLEPEKFEREYAVLPCDINKRTNAGKEVMASFALEAEGKTVIDDDTLVQAHSIVASVQRNPDAMALIADATIEPSIYWTDKDTGLQFKARPDIMHPHIVVDFKTTVEASAWSFQNSSYKYGYFLQAAMNSAALASIRLEMEKFVFICVEKTEPYVTGIYVCDDSAISWGLEQFHDLKTHLAEVLKKDTYEGYGIHNLRVPAYAAFR